VMAITWHGSGFAQNSFHDREFDKHDPGKRHFPLVTEAISVDGAALFVMATTALFAVLAGWLIHGNPLALAVFLIATAGGMTYNALSKHHYLAWVWLVVGWGSIAIVPYIVMRGTLDLTGLLFLGFFYANFIVNCGPESSMKDMDSSEHNIVKQLGGRLQPALVVVDGHIVPVLGLPAAFIGNAKVTLLALVPKVIAYVLGVVLLYRLGWDPLVSIAFNTLIGLSTGLSIILVLSKPWSDKETTRICLLIEMTAAFAAVVLLTPLWGWTGTAAMICLPLIYYLAVNKLTFRTNFTPAV